LIRISIIRCLRRDEGHAPGRLCSPRAAEDCTGRLFHLGRERSWLNKLEVLQPCEGLSGTIIRLVAMEAGGRPDHGGDRRQALVEHWERAGFVVMKRPTDVGGARTGI
jgi:hypothetical protein